MHTSFYGVASLLSNHSGKALTSGCTHWTRQSFQKSGSVELQWIGTGRSVAFLFGEKNKRSEFTVSETFEIDILSGTFEIDIRIPTSCYATTIPLILESPYPNFLLCYDYSIPTSCYATDYEEVLIKG